MKLLTFPGQGSQFPTMGKEVYENFNEAREVFEEASDHSLINLKKLIFDSSESDLALTENTQPAIFTVSLAVWRSLKNFCHLEAFSKEAIFAGHSLGEYSALVAAGALPLGPTALLLKKRGQFMQAAVPAGKGAMAALLINPRFEGDAFQEVKALCEKQSSYVEVANYNAPGQIVVSGEKAGVEALSALSTEKKDLFRRVVPLNVSAPFHCQLMMPAQIQLAEEIRQIEVTTIDKKYIANVDAENYLLSQDSENVTDRLIQQVSASVLWYPSLVKARDLGVTEHWEFGPSGVLSGIAKKLGWENWTVKAALEKLEEIKNAFA